MAELCDLLTATSRTVVPKAVLSKRSYIISDDLTNF